MKPHSGLCPRECPSHPKVFSLTSEPVRHGAGEREAYWRPQTDVSDGSAKVSFTADTPRVALLCTSVGAASSLCDTTSGDVCRDVAYDASSVKQDFPRRMRTQPESSYPRKIHVCPLPSCQTLTAKTSTCLDKSLLIFRFFLIFVRVEEQVSVKVQTNTDQHWVTQSFLLTIRTDKTCTSLAQAHMCQRKYTLP